MLPPSSENTKYQMPRATIPCAESLHVRPGVYTSAMPSEYSTVHNRISKPINRQKDSTGNIVVWQALDVTPKGPPKVPGKV